MPHLLEPCRVPNVLTQVRRVHGLAARGAAQYVRHTSSAPGPSSHARGGPVHAQHATYPDGQGTSGTEATVNS